MSRTTVCLTHDDAVDLFRGRNGERFGGAETQIYLMAKSLASVPDIDVIFVAESDMSDLRVDGISFRRTRSPISRGIPYASRLVNRWRILRPYRNLERAVVVQTIAGGHTVSTYRSSKALGHKFVYRMSCDADVDGSILPANVVEPYLDAIRGADGVIAQSVLQQQRLRDELSVESTVIPNLVQVPDAAPEPGGSYVLWVGRCAPIKRPWIMIETARRLPQYQFVMVMPKEDELFWMSVIGEASHVQNLKIVEGASYFEMDQFFRDAAVLVSTSAVEGFPNVFLQAAAQGTPIISLDVDPGGMLELDGCGWYAAGDVDAMRESIVEAMSNSHSLSEKSANSYEYVSCNHKPEVVTPQLVQFLHSVAAG